MTFVNFKNSNGAGFPALRNQFNFPSLFADTLERIWNDEEVNWMPSVNITERPEDYKIDLAVPGMDKKDFNVEVHEGTLVVSGERKEETTTEGKTTRREFHYGTFKRTFTLPDTANQESVSASYKDGILTLVIAKKEEAKPLPKRQITVE